MLSLAIAMEKFPLSVLSLYDFSNASYKGALERITGIICPTHGEFSQYAAQLRKGAGCPVCGGVVRASKRRMSVADFVFRCNEIHNSFYGYGCVEYKNAWTTITVSCPVHGAFQIKPQKHIEGQGCPACGALKRGIRKTDVNVGALAAAVSIRKHKEGFIARAQAVHGDLYDYSNVNYTGIKKAIEIICRVHGPFKQRPEKHLYEAQGCPQCSHHMSKQEEAIARFLSKFTSVVQRDRTIIGPKELDIYLPEKALAVEYCGMYWHSHFDADDERANKKRHADKHQACAAVGVRLITVYESEWQERQPQIKRLLRNAVGKSKGKLMARKCTLSRVTVQDARGFFEAYHPQGGNGHGEHYGLYWNGKLVACMRFTLGSNDRGHNTHRVWTLSRYATRINVAGAASRLFKAFLFDHNPVEVKSFSDNRFFSGAMYEALGFVLEEDVPPDYQVWSPKIGLHPKPHYQRRALPTRQKEHGAEVDFDPATDLRTEAEMTYSMGCGRIFDCGKKRWRWQA